MPTVNDILSAVDRFAPFSAQCGWDNSGLLLGNADQAVNRIGFALDLTRRTMQAAVEEMTAAGLDVQISQVAVSNARKLGGRHMMAAENPIFIITGEKAGDGNAAIHDHSGNIEQR